MSERLNINQLVAEAISKYGEDNIVLLDVRTEDEYIEGHIPKSIHIALKDLDAIITEIPDTSTNLLVYCRSGVRSGNAVSALKLMGYVNAINVGGIIDWHGDIES